MWFKVEVIKFTRDARITQTYFIINFHGGSAMISTIGVNDVNHTAPPAPGTRLPNFQPNEQELDVAVLQLNDHGDLVNKQSLAEVLQHIETARKENPNGAIVTLFAHGWHHGSDWDDSHFVSFRGLLSSLCLREAERYDDFPRGRRVIGIYLAWDGDPDDSWLAEIPFLKHLTFWDRYETASNVGSGGALYKIVYSLILATKSPLQAITEEHNKHAISPLILVGQSMGAILVELAFLSLLKAKEAAVSDDRLDTDDIVDLKRDGDAILAPDLVLALNSAADSEIAEEIKELLVQQKWRKVAESPEGDIRYNPPVLLSLTSSQDHDTGRVWRFARPFRKTDGHNSDLFTHTFTELCPATCNARGPIDFGQCWHCVRLPDPAIAESPSFAIDLPIGERHEDGNLEHMRYELHSETPSNAELAWIFQIPGELCEEHNDIFNPQMGSLVLSLMQISGSVMSLANNWTQTFEN